MKIRSSVIVALITATALAGPALLWAQSGQQQSPPDDAARRDADAAVEQAHQQLVAELKLTDAQGKPVREALAAYRRDDAAWLARNAPEVRRLRKQMGKYHTARDAETIKAVKVAMGRLAKLKQEQAAIQTALLDRLKALLAEQQFAQAQAAIAPRPKPRTPSNKFHYLGKLGLTKDQLAKIKTIMEEAEPAAGNPPAVGDPMKVAWARIVKEVLTEKDRVQLVGLIREASHRRMVMAMFANVRLTKEQAAKIDTIWAEAYQTAAKEPGKRFEIYSAAQQEAIRNVLTNAQREQLPKAQAKNPIPMGHPPRHPTTASARTPRPLPLPPVQKD